jgi:CheY-like chemotaxis protein
MIATSHLLLVEDDPGDVRLAMAVLSKLRMANRAVVVNDGEEAMEFLYKRGKFARSETGAPSVILLDLKLPRVNGFELLQRLKSDAMLKSIPVVVLTSSCQERDVSLAYEMGACAYVVKSIDYATYSATLRDLAVYWLDVNEPPPATQCRGRLAARSGAGDRRMHWTPDLLWLWAWPHGFRSPAACGSGLLSWRWTAT